jgi:hypothetical protein
MISIKLVIQIASSCYMIGLRFDGLTDLLIKTVPVYNCWPVIPRLSNGSACSEWKNNTHSRVFPDDGRCVSELESPVAMLNRLRYRSVGYGERNRFF